jgi:hypothetical protein
MWCTSARRQHHLSPTNITVGSTLVTPSPSERDLGIYIDADLVMRTHVQKTVSRCFATLRQLRSIRRSVPTAIMQTCVVSLVFSRLDYGNAILVDPPVYLQCRLESMLNSSARLIYDLRRSDHISDALASLHWLRLSERIKHKIALRNSVLYVVRRRYTCPINWCVSMTFHLVASCDPLQQHS